jgi:hypothetical protein
MIDESWLADELRRAALKAIEFKMPIHHILTTDINAAYDCRPRPFVLPVKYSRSRRRPLSDIVHFDEPVAVEYLQLADELKKEAEMGGGA